MCSSCPRAAEGIARFVDAGYAVAVVTNQRGIALDLMTADDVARVNAQISSLLAVHGVVLDRWYTCPHDIGTCGCRKPLPGLLVQAVNELRLDLATTIMAGDSETDVAAGRALGLTTALVTSLPHPVTDADLVVRDIVGLADRVLGR